MKRKRSSWRHRTRRDATVAERLLPRIRVIDAAHPLFGQPLEVSASGLSRRIGWIRVVLPDGRHRWVPQNVNRHGIRALTHFRCSRLLRWCDEARTEEIKLAAAVHLAFDQFEPRDLTFGLAVGPGLGQGCGDRGLIRDDALAE